MPLHFKPATSTDYELRPLTMRQANKEGQLGDVETLKNVSHIN